MLHGIYDSYAVTVVDGVAYGLLLFCPAAGLTLIFGVMRVLSLVHGTFYLAGAYLAWIMFDGTWTGLAAALAVGAATGVVAGTVLEAALRPLADRHLDQVLATLGAAIIAGDIYTHVFGAQPLPIDPPTAAAGSFRLGAHSYPWYRLVFIVAAALIAVTVFAVLERSRVGTMVWAVVADPAMAAATGVPTRLIQVGVLAAGAALAVVAGVLGAPVLGPGPGVDTSVLVTSLIVVVIGGLGSIRGTLLAALGVGQVTTLGVVLWPSAAAFGLSVVMFVVLVLRRSPLSHAPARPA